MFLGRDREIELLRQRSTATSAQLMVIYGRRRIGKTTLITEAFKDRLLWKFEGLEGLETRKQIAHFLATLADYCGDETIVAKFKGASWTAVLKLLYEQIKSREIVVFFDEFQWSASMRKELVVAFKWALDNYFHSLTQCKFVLCGSVSSFMVNKVLRSKALYGRVDLELNLQPLSLRDSRELLGGKRSDVEVIESYMVFGGIPQYLKQLSPDRSLVQNLFKLAYSPHGYFVEELQRLFVSHFGKNGKYRETIEILADNRKHTIRDLSKSIGAARGGTFSALLADLASAGFIQILKNPGLKPSVSSSVVRLADEFLHFYFSLIAPFRNEIRDGSIDASSVLMGRTYEQWCGYAFERLCLKHHRRIAKILEFSGIRYLCSPWFGGDNEGKAQIDLVFNRADKVATLCEAKFVNSISTKVVKDFERKVEIFSRYNRLGIHRVLILGKNTEVSVMVERSFDVVIRPAEFVGGVGGNIL